MNTYDRTLRDLLSPLALALSAALLAPAAGAGDSAEFIPYESETYGTATGDIALPFVGGLILELVNGDTATPSLRLFGGIPGHSAAIMVAADKTSVVDANGTALIAGTPLVYSGQFDWTGYYEVPIELLPQSAAGMASMFAQGIHTTGQNISADNGTVYELSNGLEFFPKPVEVVEEASLASLLPHLPDDRKGKMVIAQGLEEKLRAALNSSGDELVVKLKLSGSCATGAALNVGVVREFQAKVSRTDEGRYDVEIGQDVAMSAGVEATEGNEVNAYAGVGGTRIFRFHSISGVVRGIKGIGLALSFPNLQPGRALAENGSFDKAKAAIEHMRVTHELALQRIQELEVALFALAQGQLEVAMDQCEAAYHTYQSARWYFDHAWSKTWWHYLHVAVTYANYHLRLAALNAAKLAIQVAQLSVDAARHVGDAARAKLQEAIDVVARIGRMVVAIGQTRTFATDHYLGFETRVNSAAEAQATAGIPGVKMKGLDIGVKAGVKQVVAMRWEKETGHSPRTVTIRRSIAMKNEINLDVKVLSAGAEMERALVMVDKVEFLPEGTRWAEHSATLKADNLYAGSFELEKSIAQATGKAVGEAAEAAAKAAAKGTFKGGSKIGVGRVKTLKVNQEELGADLLTGILFQDGSILDSVANATVGFSIQDRRQDTTEFGFKVSYAGYGFGIEGSLEWADQGRELKKSATIQETVAAVFPKLSG